MKKNQSLFQSSMLNQIVCFNHLLIVVLLMGFLSVHGNYKLAENSFDKGIYNFAIINYLKVVSKRDNSSQESKQKWEKSFYRLVESYYYLKKYSESLKWAEDYHDFFPQGKWNLSVNYFEALTLLAQKKYLDAEKIIKSSITQNQTEVERFYLLLSEVYLKQGKNDLAIDTLKKLDKQYKADVHFFLAKIYLENEEWVKAAREISRVQINQLHFNSPDEVLNLNLEILIRSKEYERLGEWIDARIFQLKKNSYQQKFLFYKAHHYFLIQDYAKAIVNYRRFIEKYPKSDFTLEAYFYLAVSYDRVKQPILALDWLNQLSKIPTYQQQSTVFKTRVDKLNYIIYHKLGNQSQAAIYLERLLKNSDDVYGLEQKILNLIEQGSVNLSPWLGRYLENEKNNEKKINSLKKWALRCLTRNFSSYFNQTDVSNFAEVKLGKKLIELAYDLSKNPLDYFILGDFYLRLKDYKRTESIFLMIDKKLTEESKSDDYVSDVLGFIYVKDKKMDQAKNYFKRNLKSRQEVYKKSALFYLAEIAEFEKKYEESYERYLRYLKKYPNDERSGDIFYQLGVLSYFHFKEALRALMYFDKAQSLFKSSLKRNRTFSLMAQIYLEIKNHDQAIFTLKKISKENPDFYYQSLLSIGKVYFDLKKWDQAIAQSYEIINSEFLPQPPPSLIVDQAYYELFLIKLHQNSAREAQFYLTKLEARSPKSKLVLEGYISLGDYYYSQKKYKSAIRLYETLNQMTSSLESKNYSKFYIGLSYQNLNKNLDAYETFSNLVRVSQKNNYLDEYYFDALFEMGLHEYSVGDYDDAKKSFTEINEKSPDRSLVVKAKENLGIIEKVRTPNPFKGLKTPEEIIKKIKKLNSKQLKEKGYLLVMEKYDQQKKYEQIFRWSKLIPPQSNLYEAAVLWEIRAYWKMKAYEKLYTLGLELYLNPSFNPARIDREYFYYVLAYAAQQLGYDNDGAIFLVELKKKFPDSKYLKKLESP